MRLGRPAFWLITLWAAAWPRLLLAQAHGPHAAHGGFLGLNWWVWRADRPPIGWFLLDFIAFIGVLVAFGHKPLRRALRRRHEFIKRAVHQAVAAHAEATVAQQRAREKLSTLDTLMAQALADSSRDGQAEQAQLIATARAYADRLGLEGQAQGEQDVQRMQEALRRRVLDETINQAMLDVAAQITADDRARLIDEAIDALPAALGPKPAHRQATLAQRPSAGAKQEKAP